MTEKTERELREAAEKEMVLLLLCSGIRHDVTPIQVLINHLDAKCKRAFEAGRSTEGIDYDYCPIEGARSTIIWEHESFEEWNATQA